MYNPGVTDISGQLRAQGTVAAGKNYGEALSGIGDALAGFHQNQIMANQALGTVRGAMAANPELNQFLNPDTAPQGASPEVVKLFQKYQKDGSLAVKDAALLSQFVQSYGQTKAEAQKQALLKAQVAQATANAEDYASQAKQRDLQNKLLARQNEMLESAFNGQNPTNPLTPPQAQPEVDPFHAPTSAPPTRNAIFRNIVQAVGQIPKAETVDDAYRSAMDSWNKVERPIGYVAGGQEKDKEGKDVQNYYPTVVRNDGSILQAKEPIKIYAGMPPPGAFLDGKTFKPLTAAPIQPASVAPQNLSEDAKKDIVDAAGNINKLSQGMKYLDGLFAVNEQMKKKRWAGMSGLTGSEFVNNTVEPMMGDNTGQMFDALGSKFVADVMGEGGVKNIRNIYEFKATTANIPKANQTPETRDSLLYGLKEKMAADLIRNQKAIQLMKAGASPDSAWAASTPGVEQTEVGKAQPVVKELTTKLAQDFLQQAKGDKAKARELARNAGYKF